MLMLIAWLWRNFESHFFSYFRAHDNAMSALVTECDAIGETHHAVVRSTSSKVALRDCHSQLAVRLHAALVRADTEVKKMKKEKNRRQQEENEKNHALVKSLKDDPPQLPPPFPGSVKVYSAIDEAWAALKPLSSNVSLARVKGY